jgi:hypothetical protein
MRFASRWALNRWAMAHSLCELQPISMRFAIYVSGAHFSRLMGSTKEVSSTPRGGWGTDQKTRGHFMCANLSFLQKPNFIGLFNDHNRMSNNRAEAFGPLDPEMPIKAKLPQESGVVYEKKQ